MAIWHFCISVALNIGKTTDKENQFYLIRNLEKFNSLRVQRINQVTIALHL